MITKFAIQKRLKAGRFVRIITKLQCGAQNAPSAFPVRRAPIRDAFYGNAEKDQRVPAENDARPGSDPLAGEKVQENENTMQNRIAFTQSPHKTPPPLSQTQKTGYEPAKHNWRTLPKCMTAPQPQRQTNETSQYCDHRAR
ncbi:hypothetical protein [Rhizobium sp. L1K21]|uniref:hypothetical protein n=1 Tax=Rhizobium sp. L1K21 TaxID=2954933 RepID=UPI002093FD4D|nr:hypothetical protein [Rhizobium sp. L1K21]MCO6184864.1 hypothetical protein [Rhizobium sp. L1K21]